MNKDICAGVITFNPDLKRLEENIISLHQQNTPIYIIDNGSKNIKSIEKIVKPYLYKLIKIGENKGIAAALNILMKHAEDDGFKWVLSMDQDTLTASNLIEEYKKHLSLESAAAICPGIKKNGEISLINKDEYELIDRCPTSGFLCNIEIFKKTVGYDEWMFIDYVDYDICMKLKLVGYNLYRINTTYIIQELGAVHTNSFIYYIGKLFNSKKIINFSRTYNHSPFRNYYFVRNSLYYIKKYKKYINYRDEYKKIVKWELKKLILEKEKLKHINSIVKGIKDYKSIDFIN